MKYAIVDIETTGGSAARSRITEIAILVHDGEKVLSSFQSLVNPSRKIPYNITRITGITDEMVADAPSFAELIDEIDRYTENCVFVAHNVNFDYGFIREEYKRAGKSFQRKKLCTVRLSRRIFPNRISYSLGKLCAQLQIPIKDRHRAMGDAAATTILFKMLLAEDKEDFIQNSLNQRSMEAMLPPNLPKEQFVSLPEKMGIYYFLDHNKKIVYIGKANNIRKRVHSHFSGNTNTKSKYHFIKNIHAVDYKVCGNELIALITEATEIKKHWPMHNRSLKRFSLNFALYSYEDRNGYIRFLMGRCGKNDHPLLTFKSAHELRVYLENLCSTYNLCPKLCGLQNPGNRGCYPTEEFNCNGACCAEESALEYNIRCNEAIAEITGHADTFIIKGEGVELSTQSIVLMQKGRYKGFGEIDKNADCSCLDTVKKHISTGYDDQDMQNLVAAFLRTAKDENIVRISSVEVKQAS